jgi:ribosomal protein L11 methyltransferase
MESLDLRIKLVADVGCGSGVLSIAAKMLGAGQVDAVDIDPIAVQVARQNAALNGVEIEAVTGEGFTALPASRRYDLILSNIISATLIRVAPEAFERIRPGGCWIVSGIMEANWPDVRSAAEGLGFRVAESRSEDGWVAARFERPAGTQR